jgi:hypothetical protein
MDTTKFLALMKKAVREVVREEVKLALREEMVLLRESLRNTNQAPIVEQREVKQPVAQKKQIPVKRQLTKNSILNDLLNESTPFGKDAYSEAPFSFTANDVMDFGASTMQMPGNAPTALVDINNNVVPVANEATEAVVSAITRDYSDLMKAINKKKGK